MNNKVINNSIEISQFLEMFHWFMLDKKFNQDLTTYIFFELKIDLCQIRSLFTFQTI